MDYLKIAFLFLAYSVVLSAFILQLVCFLKEIEYKETLFLSVTFLLVILSSIVHEIKGNLDEINKMSSSILLVILSLSIPINILKERIVKNIHKKNNLLIGISILLAITIILLRWYRHPIIADIIVLAFFCMSVSYSMLLIVFTKPAFLLEHRERTEKTFAMIAGILMIICFLSGFILGITGYWDIIETYKTFILSLTGIIMGAWKLPDDIKRFLLFTQRSEIDIKNLTHLDISPREMIVLKLLVNGKSYKEICNELFIALPTVKSHVSKIYGKLGVKNRVELIKLVKIN